MGKGSSSGLRRRGAAEDTGYEQLDADDDTALMDDDDKNRKWKSEKQRESERCLIAPPNPDP